MTADTLATKIKSYLGVAPIENFETGKTIYFADPGKVSNNQWHLFKYPEEIKIIASDYKIQRYRSDFRIHLDNGAIIMLPIHEEDGKQFLTWHGYVFIDTDKDKLLKRFEMEILRLLVDKWSGHNNIKRSEALKRFLIDNNICLDIFDKYPEYLI